MKRVNRKGHFEMDPLILMPATPADSPRLSHAREDGKGGPTKTVVNLIEDTI